MKLIRKYKICKLIDDYSSLTEKELELINFLNYYFPPKKFQSDVKVFINDKASYYYNSINSALYYDFVNIQYYLEHKFTLSYLDIYLLIKRWVEDNYKIKLKKVKHLYDIKKIDVVPIIIEVFPIRDYKV